MCTIRSFVAFAVLAPAIITSGCNSNLVFYEHSAFKLGISAGEDPTSPLEVSAGLKRSVVARVPPMLDGDTTSDAREAASLLSDFDLAYVDATGSPTSPANPFAGELRIRTVFASGNAARLLARSSEKTIALVATDQLIDDLGQSFETLSARGDAAAVATTTANLMGGAFKVAFDAALTDHSPVEALQIALEGSCGVSMSAEFGVCTNRFVRNLAFTMHAADAAK